MIITDNSDHSWIIVLCSITIGMVFSFALVTNANQKTTHEKLDQLIKVGVCK